MADHVRSAAWRPLYRAERGRLLLGRLRWCFALTLGGVLLSLGEVLVSRPAAAGTRLLFLGVYAAFVGAAWGATRTWTARQHAVGLAVGYMLVVAAGTSIYFANVPHGVELGPPATVATVMALTMLLPWGAIPQAVVGAAHMAGCCYLLAVTPGGPNLALLALLITSVAVSVVGARLIERYRETSFAGAWQQEQLVGLARELAQHVEVQEISNRVLTLGMPAMMADGAALALRDPHRGIYRVDAHCDQPAGNAEWWTGLEVAQDYEPLREIIERGTLEVTPDDAASEIVTVLSNQGIQRALFVTLRQGAEPVGVLCFVRRDDAPFEAGERQLACGLADQAALALRTASMVADLQRANRLKSEFVSTMSHELRTPLNVVLGFADMLEDPMFGDTERREFTQHIRNAGLELLELIENTLAVGKLEVGREDVQLERLPLRAFWTEVGRTCGDLPRSGEVAFEWSDAVPDVDFRTDPRKLAIVVRNLVGNALKFTPRGRVRCEAWVVGDNLVIRVSDTGIGIRAEDHQAIFEMFRQADSSDRRRFGGTGLGLYIVRRFVEQLGGRVTLESAPESGSVFSVILPRSSSPSFSAAA